MTKVKPTTKEQLIYYFISNISLGTYDKRFLTNLESMNVTAQKPLTTNQADLLDKIIARYSRQLHKLELNVDEMLSLPWHNRPIQSLPQFTEAHLSLLDDELILHSPFKKDFVEDFRKADINGKWNKEERYWSVPASTHTLNIATKIIEKHYNKVNYCDTITEFIQSAKVYEDCKYWNPSFEYLNGNFYVVAANSNLINAISYIPFEVELYVLARLVRHGISIGDTALAQFVDKFKPDEILFALDTEANIEIDDPEAINKLLKIKTDYVVFLELTGSAKGFFTSLKKKLEEHNIKHHTLSVKEQQEGIFTRDYAYPTLIVSGFFYRPSQITPAIGKVVHVVNSKPISIK